jgi:methylmalonyl-CoA mutase cobalamin-binding domain/chain
LSPSDPRQHQPGAVAIGAWREQLLSAFVDCDREGARSVIQRALQSGLTLEGVLSHLIHPAMDTLGDMWGRGEVALTQQFIAACAIEDAAEGIAGARLVRAPGPKVVLGTLADGHGLGVKLVSIFLRAAGMDVVDAGFGLSPKELVSRTLEEGASVVGVSVFLLRSAKFIPELQELIAREGGAVKLAVGGAPFRADPELARRVGADAWAADAFGAVGAIRSLMNGHAP